MYKEEILAELKKYIDNRDEANLTVFIETTFTPEKLLKTCKDANLIKTTNKPSHATLASILSKTLIKTKVGVWHKLTIGISAYIASSNFYVGQNISKKDENIIGNIPAMLSTKTQKRICYVYGIMHSLLSGYATMKATNQQKKRKQLLSFITRKSSRESNRKSNRKSSRKSSRKKKLQKTSKTQTNIWSMFAPLRNNN